MFSCHARARLLQISPPVVAAKPSSAWGVDGNKPSAFQPELEGSVQIVGRGGSGVGPPSYFCDP